MIWADMQNAYHCCETRKIDEKEKSEISFGMYSPQNLVLYL